MLNSRLAMSPTLSVVVPHYNHGRYVAGCLKALLGQSRPPDELILVEDGSTDGSWPLIEPFASDPRVRLVRHEKNQGLSKTVADGLALCKGDYVFIPAADDLVLPGYFEKALALLNRYPDAGICCSLANLIDADGKDLGPYRTPAVRDRPSYLAPTEFFEEYRKHGNWVTSTSAIFRRAALLEAGGFPAELGSTADGYLIHALSARYGLCFIPERLVAWRPLATSLSYSSSTDHAISLIETQDAWLERYGSVPSEHRARLRRIGFQDILDHLTRFKPFPRSEARRVAAKIDGDGLTLPLYRLALALGGGWTATKLYVYLQMPPREQARVAAGKLTPDARGRIDRQRA